MNTQRQNRSLEGVNLSRQPGKLFGRAVLLTSLLAAAAALCLWLDKSKPPIEPTITPTPTRNEPFFALRGVFAQDATMESPAHIDALLDCLEAAGANVVYAPVVYYGEAFYHSDLLPPRELDSWAYLVPQAHARGIEVYVWIYAAYLGWQQQPTWNVRRQHPEISDNWLDFSQAAARDFVADVAFEVVSKYQADGVLLDYIRWGYWWEKAGLSADDVSLTVRVVYGRLAGRAPLTAAVSADYQESQARGQRWYNWLEGGYVDLVEPMAYVSNAQLEKLLNEWQQGGFFPGRIHPILETGDQTLEQLGILRQAQADGVVLFDDLSLCSKLELVESLGKNGW